MDKTVRGHLDKAAHHCRKMQYEIELALELDRVCTALEKMPEREGYESPAPVHTDASEGQQPSADIVDLFGR